MADTTTTNNYREKMDQSYETYMSKLDSGFMRSTDPSKVADGNIARTLSPFNFVMSKDYKTYRQALAELYRVDNINPGELSSVQKYGQIDANDLLSKLTGDDPLFVRPSVVDTSVGGNSVINPRWGFGRDDDIIQPLQALAGNPSLGGLGRVYFERYQSTQQELYITVGVPEFQELWQFYKTCLDGKMANDVNYGEATNICRMFGNLLGGAASLAVKLPLFPFRFVDWLSEKLDPKEQISRYYELRSAMPMYYRYVNTILVQLGVLLGFIKNAWDMPDSFQPNADTGGTTNGSQSNSTLRELQRDSLSGDQNPDTLPLFMRATGPNIYAILSKQDFRRQGHKIQNPNDLETYMSEMSKEARQNGGLFDAFSNRAMSSLQGADKFFAFRIDKSTDSSETLSNSTGQSSIAQKINSIASAGRDATFSTGGSIDNIIKVPVVGSIFGGIKNVVEGAVQSWGISALAAAVMTGSGFVDIPDIWMGSSFSKNYSFSFTFRPPSGNNGVVYQDCYLPLAMFLGMSCPRSVGMNSYTSPFILRAYCKGMFAIPCGIVESLTITRGASDFGWNMHRLPTIIKVNMQIKDLANVMHLAMLSDASGFKVFGTNSPMQEYMHTLAGSGLNERILFSSSLARRINMSMSIFRSTWLNPDFHATMFGSASLPKIFGAMSSTSLFRNN